MRIKPLKVLHATGSEKGRRFLNVKRNHKLSILIRGLKFSSSAIVLFGLLNAYVEAAELNPSPGKGTHVTVESSELQPLSINEKTEPKDKRVVFYSDKDSSVDINENGEPNLNMRF